MTKATITFKIMNYWHAGTGAGEGAHLDALVVKNASGLPFLPGKTVKGLFKDALMTAVECGLVTNDDTLSYFGGPGPENTRFDSDMACLEFTDATLGDKMAAWADLDRKKCRQLFRQISATCIDDKGQALSKTLRTVEVTIPLSLNATVESDIASKSWIEDLRKAAHFIRYIGTNRHRGLGRAIVSIQEVTS
ncbi:MAG: hypothetical protein JW943_10530 [Deltaproteobacteria bacterium]|nr:hypothetical protein [Deltaproteobacteria bacterium]